MLEITQLISGRPRIITQASWIPRPLLFAFYSASSTRSSARVQQPNPTWRPCSTEESWGAFTVGIKIVVGQGRGSSTLSGQRSYEDKRVGPPLEAALPTLCGVANIPICPPIGLLVRAFTHLPSDSSVLTTVH